MAELSETRQRFNKWFDANYTGDETQVKEFEGKKNTNEKSTWGK